MSRFKARRVAQELEARLVPHHAANASGKAERKRYSDGSQRLRLRARGLDLPDGTALTVTIGGRAVTTLPVRGGKLDFEIESGAGASVPEAAAGETLVIACGEDVLAAGDFRHD